MNNVAVANQSYSPFLQQLSRAKQRVLLVDYDGSISPFSTRRNSASPYPGVRDLLCRIMTECRTRVIITSGRPAHAVSRMLGIQPHPETWGTHGLERLHPDGRYEGPAASEAALLAIQEAEGRLKALKLDDSIELKPAAVAVHWGGLAPADVLDIRTKAYAMLAPVASRAGLLLADFGCGVELRVRSANKGDIVRTILSELAPDVPVAYLGDATDEDAFQTLNGHGLTVLVRRQYRFTAAQVWLSPPEQLTEFLATWIRVSGGGK